MSNFKLGEISKVYPSGVTGAYNVTLGSGDREFLVIVGGEKSGKTTLLKVLAGLEEPTSGIVEIDGKDVTEVEPKDRDIAMVFRSDTLFPALTVFDNIAYGLRMRKAPQTLIEQRVKSAANILGLTEVLYRKPKVLTAAARQRVAIARAMAREPKLYLFDEPLAGIDENLRREMLNVIVNLQARMNGTFVYATKNLSEALAIGTRLAVLKNGFLQQVDTPANLYDYPANTYVAFYIGSPTINFFKDGKLLEEDGNIYFSAPGVKVALPEKILSRFDKKEEYIGRDKKLILGIRPEDIRLSEEGIEAAFSRSEESDGVRYGEFLPAGGTPFIARIDGEYSKGEGVRLAFDPQRIHLFDGETRLTLLSRDEGYKNTGFADADFVPLPYPEEQSVYEKLKPAKKQPTKKLR